MLDQVMVLKRNPFLVLWRQAPPSSFVQKTGAFEVLGRGAKSPRLKFGFACAGEAMAVDVGAEDGHIPSRQLVRQVALQQNGHRVKLPTIGAARGPDTQAPAPPGFGRAIP